MRDHVRFRSTRFTPPDTDPGQINNERYGYALATWVAARLDERGVEVDPPVPEDWGWLVGAAHGGRSVQVGCGNVDGSVTEWLVWIDADRPGFLTRMRGRSSSLSAPDPADEIGAIVDAALRSSSEIGEIEWFRVGARGEEVDHAAVRE